MEVLLEQGGFASTAAQWVTSALLLVLYLLVARHADDRRAYRAWRDARVWMFAGISVVVVCFYVLPVLRPELDEVLRGYRPLALSAYLFCKVAFWVMLIAGLVRVHSARKALRRRWLFLAGVPACTVAMFVAPTLDAAMFFQAAVAVPMLVAGSAICWRSARGEREVGARLMRGVLVLLLFVWTAYGVSFFGTMSGLVEGQPSPLALFWFANAYVDTFLDVVLTFAMIVVLVEGTHRRIESAQQARLERVRAQQEAVLELAKRPEIAAGDVDVLARVVTRVAADVLGVERVAMWSFSPDRSELRCQVFFARSRRVFEVGAVLRASEYPAYFAALEEGKFIDAADARQDPRTAEFRDVYLEEYGISSLLDVRIAGASESVGVLCHEHVGEPRAWHLDEIRFASFLADQLGQAVANQRALAAEHQRDALERQLRHAQKLEAVGQLAGGVAHDFNNLLCAILGYASQARVHASGECLECLDQIDQVTNRAAKLARKLLSFSRRHVLDRRVVAVHDVVREVVALVRRVIRESIELEVELSPVDAHVLADANEIEQVLLNLCNNARDAMPDGGRLSISTHVDTRAETVTVAIRDTGAGMSEEVQARIFEPFFTTKPAGEGTGLGLAMSYGIVEQHGGELRVRSSVGEGSTFEVVLARVPAPTEEGVVIPSPARSSAGGSETVFVVEDQDAVRTVMVKILEGAGYRVLVAEDGAVALERFDAHADELDAVLLDSVLPHVSGAQVLAHIRARRPELPVIGTSGYQDEAPATPFDALLPKPFKRASLLEAVRAALDAERPSVTPR